MKFRPADWILLRRTNFIAEKFTKHVNRDSEEYFDKGIDQAVKKAVMEAVEVFKKNGFEIKQISLPNSQYGIAVYYLVQTTEVASNLGRYDGIRYGNDRSSFGAEAKRRIMLGTFASSAGYSAKFF